MGTGGSVRWLTALLGLATAFVMVFNVVPAMRSYDQTGVLASVPFLGPQQIPTIDVVAGAGLRERAARAPMCQEGWACALGEPVIFPWVDTANGTVDAATGLPPVQLDMDGSAMQLSLLGLRWWETVVFSGPPFAYGALALAVIWLLWQVVRTLRSGDVFTQANVRRVMWVGGLIGGGSVLLQAAEYLAQRGVLAASAAAGVVEVAPSFNLMPLLLGAVVLLLAEVFRQGVHLRSEVEGLV